MNIYVSNLGYRVGAEDLMKVFSAYGQVSAVNIIADKFSSQSSGFAFIEMPDQLAAENAIRELNGVVLAGRFINTSVAVQKVRNAKRNSFY